MLTLEIGNKIQWTSAEGVLIGIIKRIYIAMNAKDQMVPWMVIENNNRTVTLCASHQNLKMMKVYFLA